ncbi:phosphotransferase family protein [Halovivax gelatinilyticus]|uniref:phosphotransferase family protein n=1 Tax=Halovivax gelatinilyticus TaxID=2961597 RepID=UPI0020CA36E6|nr:phosphotransferase family protein [Halovivax gelatinilyticus]
MTDGDFDAGALEAYLARECDIAGSETTVLHDGLNLSVALSTPETDCAYVLRRPNKFREMDSFNDVSTEHAILERLHETSIPSPEAVACCTDESVLGDPFLVTTYLAGESVPLGADLPERFRTPAARARFAASVVETMATLHTVDADRFADVCDRRPLGAQVETIVSQFEDALAATGHEHAQLRRVADWLRANAPTDATTALVHGDYRPANLLVSDDRPEIAGVLDWETAFLGDPLVELGYLLLRFRDADDPSLPVDELASRYADSEAIADVQAIDERGLAPYTSDPGSPTRAELVSQYEADTGYRFENERFYRAFAAFILAAVWEDLERTALQAGGEAARGPYIDYLGLLATAIVDGDFEL